METGAMTTMKIEIEITETCTETPLPKQSTGADLWLTCPLGDRGAVAWCFIPGLIQPEVSGDCRLD
jgi:hypothetical protein